MSETTEAKKLQVVEPAQKKRALPKPKISPIVPTDIVDCWRLYQRSLKESHQPYPDRSADDPEVIRACLFSYITNQYFKGLIVRIGKKPVGMVLADIQRRPFGAPHVFAFVWAFWIEPEYRKQGLGKFLWRDFAGRLSYAGVRNWEAWTHAGLSEEIQQIGFVGARKLMDRIGGTL